VSTPPLDLAPGAYDAAFARMREAAKLALVGDLRGAIQAYDDAASKFTTASGSAIINASFCNREIARLTGQLAKGGGQ
jgi:hypothetical protein